MVTQLEGETQEKRSMVSLQNVNFTENITNGSHNAEFGYIPLFSLGIVTIAIQIISGGLVIVTYSLFKELRTLQYFAHEFDNCNYIQCPCFTGFTSPNFHSTVMPDSSYCKALLAACEVFLSFHFNV